MRRVTVSVGTSIAAACFSLATSSNRKAVCDYNYLVRANYARSDYMPREAYLEIISDASDEILAVKLDEDEEWEIEKEKCSFCKHFLKSPCKSQFKHWSKCVDKAKEDNDDFVSVCTSQTEALIMCTTANPDYFNDLNQSGEKSDDEDDIVNEIDDSNSAPAPEGQSTVTLEKSEASPPPS